MKRPERPNGPANPARLATPPAAQKPTATQPSTQKPAPVPKPAPTSRSERPPRAATPPLAPHRAVPSERRAGRLRRKYERAEVKRFTRRQRRRRMGGLTVLAVLAVGAGLIAVTVFSPILALREIQVEGAVGLDPAVIQEAVSGQLGTPLALIDDERIRQELSQFTSIRSYVTELVPPGTLVIHIIERTPLAAVASPAGFDIVDVAGVVLESTSARPVGLPLLQIDAEGAEGTGFAAMTEVLVALPPEVLAQVDSISARTRDDVTLRLVGSEQRVVWGSAADSDRKALSFATMLSLFVGGGAGEYDVSAPGSAVFRPD